MKEAVMSEISCDVERDIGQALHMIFQASGIIQCVGPCVNEYYAAPREAPDVLHALDAAVVLLTRAAEKLDMPSSRLVHRPEAA